MPEQENKSPWPLILIFVFVIVLIISAVIYFDFTPKIIKDQYSKVSSQFKDLFDIIKDPEQKLTTFGDWKSGTKAVEKEIPKGVEITSFEADSESYGVGESIETTGIIKIYGLEDKSTIVNFECKVNDKEGEVFISGREGDYISIPKQGKDYLDVSCKFDDLGVGEHDLVLGVGYKDYITRSWVRVYVLDEERLRYFNVNDINAFDYYGVREPNLDRSTGAIDSEYTYGPLKITLGLFTKQPLDEEGLYKLNINLVEDKSWKGKIEKIKSLRLIFPFNLDVEAEECIFGDDLILTENEFSEGEVLRNQLKDDGLNLKCKFRVSEASEELTFTEIKLQAVYDYVFEKETTVEIK